MPLTFTDSGRVATQQVFLRARWAHDWQEEPHLWCNRAIWAAAPSIGQAELRWRFGHGRRHGETAFDSVFRLENIHRSYVKIVYTISEGVTRTWYGVIDATAESQHGAVNSGGERISSGIQPIVAYDLSILLDRVEVNRSTFFGPNFEGPYTAARGLTFNRDGLPNRSNGKQDGAYIFDGHDPNRQHWTTANIVEYLMRYVPPVDHAGDVKLPWQRNDADSALPTWDRPVVETQGRTLRDLLNSLIDRRRLMSWWIRVPAEEDVIQIRPFTFAADVIDIEAAGGTINPNADQVELITSTDRSGDMVVFTDTSGAFDQIIARGARRRNCFSIGKRDSTLDIGFPAPLEAEYEAAASGAGDYPASTEIAERQQRNALARGHERLRSVYSRFVIPDSWDGKAGSGDGVASKGPVAPLDTDPTVAQPLYDQDLRLLPTIPLLGGHDYTDGKIAAGTVTTFASGPFEELPPLLFFERPNYPFAYVAAEALSYLSPIEEEADSPETREFSVRASTPADDPRAVMLEVIGGPQHAIAFTDFTPLAVDDEVGEWDWRNAILTVAIEDDRFAEGRFPATPQSGFDVTRTLVIEAGDGYRLDYVAPNTAVAVDPAFGTLKTSTGGFVRDDRPALRGIAELAWQWYSQERKAITYSTSAMQGSTVFELGYFILSVGAEEGDAQTQDVNSCITEIEIVSELGEGTSDPPPPRMTFRTAFGELDAMQF